MEFKDKLNVDWLLKEISPYGKGEKLKSTRPKDAVAGYVWRMIRFHSGLDYHHPISCFFYLFNQLKTDDVIKKRFYGIFDPEHTSILNKLEPLMIECADKLSLSSTVAARRFKGILY